MNKLKSKISFIVHATENEKKIYFMLQELFSIENIENKTKINKLNGHYKNPIKHVEIKLSDEEIKNTLEKIEKKIGIEDRETLEHNLEEYIDKKGNLYLRLDKQDICLGKIVLCQYDAIRIYVENIIKNKKLLGDENSLFRHSRNI